MLIDDKDIHKGHRSRMRAKLAAHGPRIFDTYELLEMLLYYAIPYKDTNPIAKRLLSAFGSLDGVLRADEEKLAAVDGIGKKCARLIRGSGDILTLSDTINFGSAMDVFDDYNLAGSYFVNHFKSRSSRICIALLDNGMRLIETVDIPGNDFASGAIRPKPFIDAALSAGATVAILAHVHEHGALYPTEGDMATDRLIRAELKRVGVVVAEHYIVGGPHYVGLKLGLSIRVGTEIEGLERFYRSIPVMAGNPELTQREDFDERESELSCESNPFEELMGIVIGSDKAAAASRELFSRYGRLHTILSENEEEICRVGSLSMNTALFIKLVGYINSRRVTDRFEIGQKYSALEIIEYIRALYIGLSVEVVYILSFDAKGRFLGCDFIGEGTVGASDIYPRKLLEVAIKRKSASVILAHNHPKGMATPSADDTVAMKMLSDVFREAGVSLDEHYIVADGRVGCVEKCRMF